MHKWTGEELDRLRELCKAHTIEECARIMGVTSNTVRYALARHHIARGNRRICKRRKPIGSELFDGKNVMVKAKDPDVWRLKKHVIWEEHYGKLKDDEVVLILNGDPKDVRIENLMKVTKRELAVINRNRLHSKDTEIGRAKALLGRLLCKKRKLYGEEDDDG